MRALVLTVVVAALAALSLSAPRGRGRDRKSTRLNSSHGSISYAVVCLKKKRRPGSAALALEPAVYVAFRPPARCPGGRIKLTRAPGRSSRSCKGGGRRAGLRH